MTFGKDPVFFSSGSSTERKHPLVTTLARLSLLTTLTLSLVAAGAVAVSAQDEPTEAEVIGAFISETYNADWTSMQQSDWLAVESELVGLAEDSTHILCHDYALRGAAFFRGIASTDIIDSAGAWAIYETLDSSRNACYWAEGSLS